MAAFLVSCVSTGTKFDLPETTQLRLGELTIEEANTAFGKPSSIIKKTTTNGTFEVLYYLHERVDLASIRYRSMALEFREGKLNAFSRSSSFDNDKTQADLAKAQEIQAGISKLTKDDVLRIAGEPGGRFLCPTQFEDYKDKCGESVEIWSWFARDKKIMWSEKPVKVAAWFVSFDSKGLVKDVETAENNP